ncbi:MAG: methyltransferase [Oscillospiraceae bacterium]|nr:methyltransferase [Oscillospiraceae bacterium]
METLQNGITLDIAPGTFPLSTDSMLLGRFVTLKRNARVLDLGSGCGTLGAILCAKDETCVVTGMEIDPTAHDCALENIDRNDLQSRLFSICADIRDADRLLSAGSFDACVSNPPYYRGGPQSKQTPTARRNDLCQTQDLFAAAAWALRWGGDFFLVHKPEYLGQLCGCAVQNGLEPKKLCLVRHHPGKEVSLILLQCRKGGKPGLKIEEISLFDETLSPTKAYREAYHL